MKTELKGWLADNTVTTDNKEDKILVLESAGNLTLSDVLDEMKKEDTGLRAETLKHAVDLFQRTVSELVLNGYSVNTGLFRAVPFSSIKTIPTAGSVPVTLIFYLCFLQSG